MRPAALLLALLAACTADPPLRPRAHDAPRPPLTEPGTTEPLPGIPGIRLGSTPFPHGPRAWPPKRSGYVNPIPAENDRAGDPGWLGRQNAGQGQIEGYADRVSARAGESVAIHVSADAPHAASWVLFRMGDYHGAGARRVAEGGPVSIGRQPDCPVEPGTGLVRCAWSPTFSLTVAKDWLSGLYALRLTRDDGFTRFVPLVITDDRPADVLLQASVTTYQAYNSWGGTSLYVDHTGKLPAGMASAVSFDRPYDDDRGLGQMLRYEPHLARFLERHGYDVTYTTNVDVAMRGAAHLYRAGIFLSVGHDEYWDVLERDAAETARDAGVPLAFFSANTGYWKIRFDDGGRVMRCYKSGGDPIAGRDQTGQWRELGRPENALLGVMFEPWVPLPFPWVVANDRHFLYAATGLSRGDALPHLVGYEADRRFDNGAEPPGIAEASASPVITMQGNPGVSHAVSYRAAASGALVFSAGTIDWARALGDPDRRDERVDRMTANVLHEALGLAVPTDLPRWPGGPRAEGPFAAQVRTMATGLAGPGGVAVLPDGSIAVAETLRHRILRFPLSGGFEVLAGDGEPGDDPYWDHRPGATARFNYPTALATGPGGELYVADTHNHAIRVIAADADHTVTTLAGSIGLPGFRDGTGEDARFFVPRGLALDTEGNRLLVADMRNDRIRAIDLTTSAVTTFGGGDGTWKTQDGPLAAARFMQPTALTLAPDGRLFVVDSGDAAVQVVDVDADRTVTTLAGGIPGYGDGAGDLARLLPQGGAVWKAGFVVLTDPGNFRVRLLAPGTTAADSRVNTFVGSGRLGTRDGDGDEAEPGMPAAIAVDPDLELYVTDAAGGRLLQVDP